MRLYVCVCVCVTGETKKRKKHALLTTGDACREVERVFNGVLLSYKWGDARESTRVRVKVRYKWGDACRESTEVCYRVVNE